MEKVLEKFTPGPWKHTEALPRLVEARVARRNGWKIPVTVCHLGEGNGWCKERKWNAFLIAAAPEMYEFGETTAEVLQLLLERLGPKPAGLDAEIKRLAEERIAEWIEIGKKARGEK